MYKIVEVRPNKFIAYKKWFIWWCAFKEEGYAGHYTVIYHSLVEAEYAVKKHVALVQAKQHKTKFKERTFMYNDKGESFQMTFLPPRP